LGVVKDLRRLISELIWKEGDFVEGGIHWYIVESVKLCPVEKREELLENIVLSGGNTMFAGFETRLKFELEKLVSSKIKVVAKAERMYLPWIGGSVYAAMPSFASKCTTREEFDATNT
jgi:actin-related protein